MRSSTARQKSEARKALHDLLVELFDEAELRRWVRSSPDADIARVLPASGASMDELVDALIAVLQRRNRIDSDFYDRLVKDRPQFASAIGAISATWSQIDWRPQDLHQGAGPAQWPSAVLLLGVSAFFFMGFTFVAASVLPPEAVIPVVVGTYLLMVSLLFLYEQRFKEALASGAMSLAGLHRSTTNVERALWVTGLTGGVALGANVGGGLADDARESGNSHPSNARPTRPEELSASTAADLGTTGALYLLDVGSQFDETSNGCAEGYVHLVDRCLQCPPRMAVIPGGAFDGHTIADLCVDETEVTVSDYQECVRGGRCSSLLGPRATIQGCNSGRTDRAKHPINCVTWMQAKKYCEAKSKRLPTLWEWVWTARGRDKAWTYPWGNVRPNCRRAVMYAGGEAGCGKHTTSEVGSLPKGTSRDGVKDLAGNVKEWTASVSENNVAHRYVAGGGWGSGETAVAVAEQTEWLEDEPSPDIGFRCVTKARSMALGHVD